METKNGVTPDLGAILNGLLSNPSALSSLSSILGNMSDNIPKKEDVPAFSQSDTASAPLPKIHPSPPLCPRESKERALLLAIKPFLSKNKCDTLDIFIRLLDIISLVGGIK